MISLEQGLEPPTWRFAEFKLRPLRSGDATAWSQYLSEPDVTLHTSWSKTDPLTIAYLVERSIADYASGNSCRWAIAGRDDGVIGTCGFSNWSLIHSHAEIVYDLDPRFWRRGIGSTAVRTVLGWAFDVAGFNRVHAFVMDTNQASIALLDRLGFVSEGLLRHYRISRGVPRNFWCYSVLREQWQGSE